MSDTGAGFRLNGKITEQVVKEYRQLQMSGKANMRDLASVIEYSCIDDLFALFDLVTLSRECYTELQRNYSQYLQHYKLE